MISEAIPLITDQLWLIATLILIGGIVTLGTWIRLRDFPPRKRMAAARLVGLLSALALFAAMFVALSAR